ASAGCWRVGDLRRARARAHLRVPDQQGRDAAIRVYLRHLAAWSAGLRLQGSRRDRARSGGRDRGCRTVISGLSLAGGVMAAPNMTVDPLPPSAPVVGDLWYNTVTGAIFLWYDDGTSAQWVTVGPGMVGPPGPPGPSSGSPGSPTRLITTPGPVVML